MLKSYVFKHKIDFINVLFFLYVKNNRSIENEKNSFFCKVCIKNKRFLSEK